MKKLNIKNWLGQSKLRWFIALYVAAILAYGVAVTLSHIIVKILEF